MAPITRSSRYGASMRPEDHPPDFGAQNLDAEWDDEGGTGDEEHLGEEEQAASQEESDDAAPPFQSTAHEFLQPLQETANRVSRQVEEFAKCLDKFNADRSHTDQTLWQDAWQLLERYSILAARRREQTASRSPGSQPASRNRKSIGDTAVQSKKLQLEQNLWTLTKTLLVCKSPEARREAESQQDSALGDLHRYSSNSEVWNAFLDSDVVAQEYECTLDWLQEAAAQTATPIEQIISELTAKSERGTGIWAAGPLFTKDSIKGEKRSRAWPMPLDSSDPGLRKTHYRNTDQKPIVAQLDPDAPTRENAKLLRQDEFHEEAAWQVCWEMLRRGQTAEDSRAWWAERKEFWRSAVVRNCRGSREKQVKSPWLRLINLASNQEWFEQCKKLSETLPDTYYHQIAVYGLLCGHHPASARVCQTVDDHLFSYFNALLIERYQQYLTSYSHKLNDASAIVYQPAESKLEGIRRYLASTDVHDEVRSDQLQSHRFVEIAIIGQDFNAFFTELGEAAAQVAHMTKQSAHLIDADPDTPQNDCAQATAQDQDSMRMVAHLQLLLHSLGHLNSAYADHLYVVENNIASYIGFLQRERKWDLIPLYASKLSPNRVQRVLGAVLISLIDAKERDTAVRLMKQYHIDVSSVLYGIFFLANYDEIQKFRTSVSESKPPKITAYVGAGKVRTIKVHKGFMSEPVSERDETAIRSVEWCKYIDAENWWRASWSASLLYKIFLLEGRLSSAKELLRRASLRDISLSAFGMNVTFADASEEPSENGDGGMDRAEDDDAQPISPQRKRREPRQHPLTKPGTSRESLAAKSMVWAQLEQLVVALEALERWNEWSEEVERNRDNKIQMRTLKRELRDALDEVRAAMYPLLDKDFLMQPMDEEEGVALAMIRNHYMPECILAYNSALYFAGHAISRSWLVECMNLATLVAQNEMLTDAFVASKRMRELVTAFALDSQALLRANEQGGSTGKGKGKNEAGNAIWQVKWRDQGDVDLEALD